MPLQPHKIGFVSIILPTYNEAGNIVELVETIHKAVPYPKEIIVVDDNSPDGTSRLIQELIAKKTVPELRLETRLTDRGFRKSIARGIELSKGDTIVWMDCDFSMPPEAIPELLAKIEQGWDIAVGSRFLAGGEAKAVDSHGGMESPLVIVLSRILNWLTRTLLYPSFHDYTSGFIAIHVEALKTLPLRGDYGEHFMSLIVRAHIQKKSIVEIPYICAPRFAGESKTGQHPFRFGIKYLRMLAKLWWIKLRNDGR